MTGTLYIVPTPIGHLDDITLRALRVLQTVSFIAAEDTRHTRKLLTHFEIRPDHLFSYHEHNTEAAGQRIVAMLRQEQSGALVTDAGMPGISDPGHGIIRTLIEQGLPFVVLPGPSAFVMALVASGLSTTHFSFFGFLPRDKKHRRAHLETLRERPETLLFYEAPHRLQAMLADVHAIFGDDRELVVARELTKLHESWYRGPLSEWATLLAPADVRGEMVVLLEGARESHVELGAERRATVIDEADLVARVTRMMQEGVDKKEAMRLVAKACGVTKRDVYQALVHARESDG